MLEDGTVRAMEMAQTGAYPPESAARVLEAVLGHAGVRQTDLDLTSATGTGREHLPGRDSIASEISCHAAGVARLIVGAGTVIEIGGQDSKGHCPREGWQGQGFPNERSWGRRHRKICRGCTDSWYDTGGYRSGDDCRRACM